MFRSKPIGGFSAALALTVFLAAAATAEERTVQWPLSANLPVRSLPVYIITDGSLPDIEIKNCIARASAILSPQVGIRLVISGWKHDSDLAIDRNWLPIFIRGWHAYPDADGLILQFIGHTAVEQAIGLLFGEVKEVVEARHRRQILMECTDPVILAHSLGHAFIFSHVHSGSGFMMPGFLCDSVLFNDKDRREILANKWRDFKCPLEPEPSYEDEPVWSWRILAMFILFFV
jgi:hypothetical protein